MPGRCWHHWSRHVVYRTVTLVLELSREHRTLSRIRALGTKGLNNPAHAARSLLEGAELVVLPASIVCTRGNASQRFCFWLLFGRRGLMASKRGAKLWVFWLSTSTKRHYSTQNRGECQHDYSNFLLRSTSCLTPLRD